MKRLFQCLKCKHKIASRHLNEETKILFCDRCNYYFPSSISSIRKKDVIRIPNRSSNIRFWIEEDSLKIKFKWLGNYSLIEIVNELQYYSSFPFIGYLFNKTIITVDRKVISIDHKPLDLLPMTYYESKKIKQLYVKSIDSLVVTYGLFAILENGQEIRLIWNLNQLILLFIKQEIEKVIRNENINYNKEVN